MMRSNWAATASAAGWAKMVRMAAATISALALATLANTLRMKCTRPLPAGADEALGDGGLEALVVIGDDQPDAGEAPGAQRAEELGPERLGLGVAHGAAQHLSLTVAVTPVTTTTARETTWPPTRPLR